MTPQASNKPPLPSAGRYEYAGLDRILHEKARLGIMASLASHSAGLLFTDLKQLCSLTDGNLSRHLTVLSDAGLVEIWKGTQGARPQTMYRLTRHGQQRFANYINVLEKVVADAQTQPNEQGRTSGQNLSRGWSPA